MSAQAPSEVIGTGSIDLRYYLRVLLKRKWLILLVFAVVVGATTLWARSQPKVYAAQISLIIDSKEPRFLDNQIQDVNNDSTSAYWANKEYIETQSKIITSRAVAQRVVEKLGLNTDAEFLGLTKLPAEQQAEVMKNVDAVARVQGKVKVESLKDSRVTFIKIEDSDPTRAALLANEVAQAYIDESLSQKLKVTENASKWLDERRDSLSESARASELALYTFRKQSDMLSTSIDDRANMVSARLTATSQALTDVQLKIAGYKARVAAIRNVQQQKGSDDSMWAEALPAARENQTLQKLKDRMLTLRTECTELQSRYLEQHPKLMECRDKLALVEKDFQRELSNLVVGTEAELREAIEKERNLLVLFNEAKTEAFEVEKKKLELDRLKQESDSAKRQYDSVFKRLKDIELSGLLRTSNVRVLDAARPQLAPVRPNVPQSILLGVVAGLIAGLGLALLLEFLDSSVTSQQEIEERLGLTFLGFVPTIPTGAAEGQTKDLHIHREPKSHIAECTRAVRTNLLFMSPDKPLRRMLVTSSGPQEGKSTTAINLAIAMAQSGQKVLIIDTDMRRPRLHKAFGVPNDVGVSSLVVGEGKLEDAIKTTEVPGVYLLPCGPVPPNPAELLHTKAFAELLETLDGKFDRVILDSPPVGAVSDAVVLATQVAGVVMVLKAGVTHRDVAKRTVRALNDVKAPILGAVLNDVNLERSRYGDYYYGYAYRYYGYGEKNG
ncbi:MAG: polysaccharide biosynthesis tyrosine autokinase [Myxococcaceae bacterium]|nr:polysaccharide biosynthesis tyrosine autokinase [Myxococcaceae bacterium]